MGNDDAFFNPFAVAVALFLERFLKDAQLFMIAALLLFRDANASLSCSGGVFSP
jgi:hypothetical protein